jgi:opacity protein-like surface antigen
MVRTAVALIAAFTLACASPAAAQNTLGDHQVRFGVFGHFGHVGGSATKGAASEDYGIFTKGIGATAGLEWIRGDRFVWGIESDITVLGGNDTVTANELSPNLMATFRLRAGTHLRPDLLWYATAGLGLLGMETKFPAGQGGTKNQATRAGYVVGTGLEWQRPGAILFAEYLFSDYGTFNATSSTGVTQRYDADSHAFRIGVKFLVGHHHYRDDVAERIGRVSK